MFDHRLVLSRCAAWNPNATTVIDSNSITSRPDGIFIAVNDTVYVAVPGMHQAQMWLDGGINATRVFNASGTGPSDVFVTSGGVIYVDNGALEHRVDKWTVNASSATTAMWVNGTCFGLFVDIHDNLYCSSEAYESRVTKRWLNGPLTDTIVVAGNGTVGSTSEMLDGPRGIFVDLNLRVYVADCRNNRIQLFPYGQSNGTTVAGNGATGSMNLNCPVDVILDANEYLFIADYESHRIIAAGPHGSRCIVGCTGTFGATPDRLQHPTSLSFDSKGNLFVSDGSNNRIQKFLIVTNSCGTYIVHRCIMKPDSENDGRIYRRSSCSTSEKQRRTELSRLIRTLTNFVCRRHDRVNIIQLGW